MSNLTFIKTSINEFCKKLEGRHTSKLKSDFERFSAFVKELIVSKNLTEDKKAISEIEWEMHNLQKAITDKEKQNEWYRKNLEKIKKI